MEKLIITFTVLLAVFEASASEWNEILYFRGRSLGNTPLEQIKKSETILNKTKRLLDQEGVSASWVQYKDGRGNQYKALKINPGKQSALNEEALRVEKELGQLPLIFSPYDLSRSRANAFFDSDGSKLGVSYRFISGEREDSSYLHELQHASTYKNVLRGRNFLWAGILKAPFGKYISAQNNSYYESFASLDEIVATSLSVMLDTRSILEMKRELPSGDFFRSRGNADILLNEIYHSVKAGLALAKQLNDVSERALGKLSESRRENTVMVLGKERKNIVMTVLQLDAYAREFKNGRGTMVAYPKETEWKLFWNSNYTQNQLRQRILRLNYSSKELIDVFGKIERCIDVLIEYPRIEKTDFKCLEDNGKKAFLTFQNY